MKRNLSYKNILCFARQSCYSLAIIICSAMNSSAQESVTSIQGKVVDENKKEIAYATVSLLNARDSTVFTSMLTTEQGNYTFTKLTTGNYLVRVHMIGFKTSLSKPIFLDTSEKNLYSLDDLQLQKQNNTLNEVVINSQKPLIERKADKMVVNVENSILAAGNNALDILERSPGVSVDKDDNISLMGKKGTLILLDGKETNLSASQLADLLRSTDGNTIQSLEIISNPSSKYEAKGTAGIINIKLKKNKISGTNGSLSVSGGYGNTYKTSNSLSLNHKNGAINIFGSYNYLNNKGNQDIGIYRTIGKESAFTSFDQLSKLNNHRINNSTRAGIDIQTSNKNSLAAQVSSNWIKYDNTNLNVTHIGSSSSSIDSILNGNTISESQFHSYSIGITNTYNIDTLGKQLNATIDISKYKDEDFANYKNVLQNEKGVELYNPIILRSNMPSEIFIQSAKLDYTHPISSTSKLEAGLKIAIVNSDNDMIYEKRNQGKWENMLERSNHFIYDEKVAAAYLNYNKSFKKVSLQAGLRTEYSLSDGNSITLGKQVKRDYLDLFPNLALQYIANENNQIGISYSKRINRPYYESLNPFTYFLDEYTTERGNPYLQPEYTQALEINYTLLKRYHVSGGLNLTKDAIVESMEQDDIKKTTTVFKDNFASSKTWFINMNTPIKITKYWDSNTNFTAFYLGFKTENYLGFKTENLDNPLNSGQFATQVNSTNTFNIFPGLRAEATLNYHSPLTYSIYKIGQEWSIDAGLNKSFKNKRANVKLSVSDIFNTKTQNITTTHANLNARINQKRETRVLRLVLSYNFGSTKIEKKNMDQSSEEKIRVGK